MLFAAFDVARVGSVSSGLGDGLGFPDGLDPQVLMCAGLVRAASIMGGQIR